MLHSGDPLGNVLLVGLGLDEVEELGKTGLDFEPCQYNGSTRLVSGQGKLARRGTTYPIGVEEAAQGTGNGIPDEGELPEEDGLLSEDAQEVVKDLNELRGRR